MLSQEPVVGSAQGVVVARARAIRDAAVQHCLERLSSQHLDFELEGSARSVVQFEGVLPEAAPCIAYAPVDLDEQASIVIDVPPEVLVRLFVHLARCLYTEHGGGLRHPLRAYRVPPYTYRCSYFCQFLFSLCICGIVSLVLTNPTYCSSVVTFLRISPRVLACLVLRACRSLATLPYGYY